MADWLESEPCSNIFQFLGHFARCSIQPFGDHFAFVQIQIIVLLAQVAVENILRWDKQLETQYRHISRFVSDFLLIPIYFAISSNNKSPVLLTN